MPRLSAVGISGLQAGEDVKASENQQQNICFASLINGLVDQQWFIGEQALARELCSALYADLQQLHQQQMLTPAGIGRGQQHVHAQAIRGDLTHWLDGRSPAQRAYLMLMHQLQEALNRELYLGLAEYESHYALYPPGSFYKKHLDSFRGRSNRLVTTVLYLNPAWQPEDGGAMRLYHPQTQAPLRDVAPQAGTLVCFLSEKIAHEVLPTHVERVSIAGWFRVRE